jgi:aspartyl-tRNA(Asn)/glutamyl-tRNA(Gln) amidotransferase subunit A
MNSANPCVLSATELLAAYAGKRLTPTEVVRASLERIERFQPKLNAFTRVFAKEAMQAAEESSARWAQGKPIGALDGVTVAVKDLLLTKGAPTLRGSWAVDEKQAWDNDAPAVARLRENGAIIVGKTTTSEYGWKGVTDSLRHGVTRNPWNPELTPGGSSGGSAVAVAGRMAALGIGTDGGGSVRIPASFTGTVGLKPTFGRVSAFPLSPVGTIAHLGPISRTVDDAALLMKVIGERDRRDWYALPTPLEPFWPLGESEMKRPRVAVMTSLWGQKADAEVQRVFEHAVETLGASGVELVRFEPDWPDIRDAFRIHWMAGAGNAIRSLSLEQQERIEKGLLQSAREGAKVTLAQFQDAIAQRERFGTAVNLFFADYDFLVTPSTATLPFAANQENPSREDGSHSLAWACFLYPFNLSQNPAISIPAGISAEGLPVGIQIVGDRYADKPVLQLARRLERALGPLAVPPFTPL